MFKFKSITNKKMIYYSILFGIIGTLIEVITGDHDSIVPDFFITLSIILFFLHFSELDDLGSIDDLINKYKKYYEEHNIHDSEKEGQTNQTFKNTSNTFDEEFKKYIHFMNLTPDASKNEIKSRYREMAREYHPDKVAQKSKQEIEKATKDMQKLNAAYEYLMKK